MSNQLDLTIRSADGWNIPAVLHTPLGNREGKALRGITVLAHGIFSNKDERGRFIRQAELHTRHDFGVLRFDFRGHGAHQMPSSDITVAGMMLDLHAILKYAGSLGEKRLYVVASSFGASVLLLYLQSLFAVRPHRIVLLNPVLDYVKTMLDAVLPWGRSLFTEEAYRQLENCGYTTLEQEFKMSAEMVFEMSVLKPHSVLSNLDIPTRIIHGDHDSKVPYEVVRELALPVHAVDFKTILGADHAFKTETHEAESFCLIKEWLYQCG